MKLNEEGARLCDSVDCSTPALLTLFWDRWLCYCRAHAQQAVAIGDTMGFPSPRGTVRMMTMDEILPETEANNVQQDSE